MTLLRGALFWLLFSGGAYVLMYVLTRKQRRQFVRSSRRAAVAAAIGLALAAAVSLLNNLSGL